jgi:hypothetical protein
VGIANITYSSREIKGLFFYFFSLTDWRGPLAGELYTNKMFVPETAGTLHVPETPLLPATVTSRGVFATEISTSLLCTCMYFYRSTRNGITEIAVVKAIKSINIVNIEILNLRK